MATAPDLSGIVRSHCHRSPTDWYVQHDRVHGWTKASPAGGQTPAAGWKLHVTATEWSAAEVLRRCLPLLISQQISFKVADLSLLRRLNLGLEGVAQIGKFLTVYPARPSDAVEVAAKLDIATTGMLGATPPTDRRLHPESAVSYRYGAFRGLFTRTAVGAIVPARLSTDEAIVPDPRLPYYVAPSDASDPFVGHAGFTPPLDTNEHLLADRYLMLGCVARTARGNTYEAIDLDNARTCVIKHGPRGRMLDASGSDARDLLRHEATVLRALQPDTRFPDVQDVVASCGDLYLVQQRLDGQRLDRYMATLAASGQAPQRDQLIDWATQLLAMLTHIEKCGWIYEDLTSGNIIVGPDGTLRLVDFELSEPADNVPRRPNSVRGTRGYLDPHRSKSDAASDNRIYSLGAVLYLLTTAAEPSHAPDGPLLRRPVRQLNPGLDHDLAELVERCLTAEPDRFPTLDAVGDSLAGLPARAPSPGRTSTAPRRPAAGNAQQTSDRFRELLMGIGDSLCAAAEPIPGCDGLSWRSRDDVTDQFALRDINSGGAGIVLALAEITDVFGRDRHREVLAAAAHALLRDPIVHHDRLPGLYVGEAGVGTALIRAGQVLEDPSLIETAARHGLDVVAAAPYACPDLFNGTAGRLRFHLITWYETGDARHRLAAHEAAEVLLDRRNGTGSAVAGWLIPPGYGDLSGNAYLGFAHGAAGIADSLLDAYEEFGDDRYARAVADTVRWLDKHHMPLSPDGRTVGWASCPGQPVKAPFWCHGGAGIAKLLNRVAELDLAPGARDLADRAAQAVVDAAWAGPTQCHGLAGNIDILIDLYQATGQQSWIDAAFGLWRNLNAFSRTTDGHVVWESDLPGKVDPGYMIGYSGVAMCLLRLSEPRTRPHQLSVAGIRRRNSRASTRNDNVDSDASEGSDVGPAFELTHVHRRPDGSPHSRSTPQGDTCR